MNLNSIFNNDFEDFIKSLINNEVKYLIVGGYSVIVHGYPRTTGDLDVWVENSEDNFIRLTKAFSEFGLPTNAISFEDFSNPENKDVFTFGRPPLAIDILTKVKGINFIEAYKASKLITLNHMEVRIIGLPDLIKAKKASGRYKDLDDLENLPPEN